MTRRGRRRPPSSESRRSTRDQRREVARAFDEGLQVGVAMAEAARDPLDWAEVADLFREDQP